MPTANCPKCENNTFEAVLQSVENINNTIAIVRCKSCYTAIGVIDITTSDYIRKIVKGN